MSLTIDQKERKKEVIFCLLSKLFLFSSFKIVYIKFKKSKKDSILIGCKWEWIINSENELELAQKTNININDKNEQNIVSKDKRDKIDFRTGKPKLEEQSKLLPKFLSKKQTNASICLSDIKSS
jgi:hypothetical protein